jgi:hypothetical protein
VLNRRKNRFRSAPIARDDVGGSDNSLKGTDMSAETTTTANATDALGKNAQPLIDKAKSFAKARPFATATLAGVLGIAFLNTLRGK